MSGTEIRMRRLFPNPQRKLFSVPLDHSVSMGPIDGLEQLVPLANDLQDGGVDLLVVTKGAVRHLAATLRPDVRLGVHISASTTLGSTSNRKVLVGTAAEAVGLGADLLSIQVNFGVPEEPEMLRDLGIAADECRTLGLPLMCMAYVKKPNGGTPEEIRHASRAAADTGADIVKTSYPGTAAEFARLCSTTPVPVLIGGGVKLEDEAAFLEVVRGAMASGGAGVCIGRNLFQRKPLVPLARRIAALLHGSA